MAYPVIPTDEDKAFFERSKVTDKALIRRMTMERMVIRRFARGALDKGYQLRVYNGEGWECPRTSDLAVVMNAIMATDEEGLHVYAPNAASESGWYRIGAITLVYGNDGYDVMADYSVKLDDLGLMAEANELADKLAG